MTYKVDNAIIMAAGLSSRFAPISYEVPKGLITVKGEVLIERQIRQLREAGILEIIVVTGYKAEQFAYLEEKFNVKCVHNPYYKTRNNNYSIYVAQAYLKNTYICSADNYFTINPFEAYVDESYYSSIYVEKESNEWCISFDDEDWITNVEVGGCYQWVMLGHVFFSEEFSHKFVEILHACIEEEETKGMLWESIYLKYMDVLPMKIRKYKQADIYEFDSLDELRQFDETFQSDAKSEILNELSLRLQCQQGDICEATPCKDDNGTVVGFRFLLKEKAYKYDYESKTLEEIL